KSGLAQRAKKGTGASVENRRLGAIHLDDEIVDADPRHCCQHMLHRVNRLASRAELRAALARSHLADVRSRLRISHEIRSAEQYARSLRRRFESNAAGHAEVQSDSFETHRSADS